MKRKIELCWNVFVFDFNQKKIKTYNILNEGIVDEIKKDFKKTSKTKEDLADVAKLVLMYYFWSRYEWEINLTEWPAHISPAELARLDDARRLYATYTNHEPYCYALELTGGKKIDVWDQVEMNWNIFVDYLWKNLGGERDAG